MVVASLQMLAYTDIQSVFCVIWNSLELWTKIFIIRCIACLHKRLLLSLSICSHKSNYVFCLFYLSTSSKASYLTRDTAEWVLPWFLWGCLLGTAVYKSKYLYAKGVTKEVMERTLVPLPWQLHIKVEWTFQKTFWDSRFWRISDQMRGRSDSEQVIITYTFSDTLGKSSKIAKALQWL
jgi:hypothetical protein